jgi:transposase-like protein
MNCPYCLSTTTTQQSKATRLCYRTLRCSACRRIFNERTGTPFNYLQYPTDIVLLVVFWRLRYKLSLRESSRDVLAARFCVHP